MKPQASPVFWLIFLRTQRANYALRMGEKNTGLKILTSPTIASKGLKYVITNVQQNDKSFLECTNRASQLLQNKQVRS